MEWIADNMDNMKMLDILGCLRTKEHDNANDNDIS